MLLTEPGMRFSVLGLWIFLNHKITEEQIGIAWLDYTGQLNKGARQI